MLLRVLAGLGVIFIYLVCSVIGVVAIDKVFGSIEDLGVGTDFEYSDDLELDLDEIENRIW